MAYRDIKYAVRSGLATVTINRPKVHNAFRARTCDELIDAFHKAAWNEAVGVIVLTGAGVRAFSSGGDQKVHEGRYDGRGLLGLPIEELHTIIRDAPKPVIAKVRGWINRPKVHNAFRARTCDELIDAFHKAAWNEAVGVIVLTGAGVRAFSSGGDQKVHEGRYDGRGLLGLPIEELHTIIRDAPKPVIAKVRGWCLGGGNVLATICDLTIAAEDAVFGQVGPGIGRDGLWHRASRQYRRRKAGQGDLVPMPALFGGRGAGHGPRQRRRSRQPAGRRGAPLVR